MCIGFAIPANGYIMTNMYVEFEIKVFASVFIHKQVLRSVAGLYRKSYKKELYFENTSHVHLSNSL